MKTDQFAVGDRLRLAPDTRRWWTVRAVSEHFAVCVTQAPFQPKGTYWYTVLDWRNGVRGPCNQIGQGYGDGSFTPEQCSAMLADFEQVESVSEVYGPRYKLEVSHRNRVPLEVIDNAPQG